MGGGKDAIERTISRDKSSWFSCMRANIFMRISCRCYKTLLKYYTAEVVLALAVVWLHCGKAFEAASMASFVSATPISGTVPSSSRVAGSETINANPFGNGANRTLHGDFLAALRVHPFAVDESLGLD